MPFARNSLYGWGVCRVLMPRASRDIFADCCAEESGGLAPDQRRETFLLPFSTVLAGLVRRDFPARTSLAIATTALAGIVLLSLSNLLIPRFFEETIPEPVEIVARLMEEPLPVPQALPKREIVAVPVQDKPRAIPSPEKIVVEARTNRPREINLPVPSEVSRSYDLPQERPALLPEPVNRSMSINAASAAAKLAAATAVKKNYRIKKDSGTGGVLPQGRVFASAAAGTIVDLPSASGIKHDFGRPRSQGDGGAPVSGRSFSPDTPSGEVAIGRSGQVARTYQVSVGPAGGTSAIPGNNRQFSNGAGRPGEPAADIPVAGGSGPLTLTAVPGGQKTSAAPTGGKVRFVTGIDSGALDPALLVSLNQLRACVDQSEEDRLRTRLATLLEKEGRCRTGNMIFFFKYPEDGWTMQVSLYNPIDFSDKCSALLAAIECINHSKQ